MTDDKPMTFEDHAHGLHLYGCGCKNGDRTACLSAIESRAAHQREVEAARREEREAGIVEGVEACFEVLRGVDKDTLAKALQDRYGAPTLQAKAILARGKP